MRPKLMILASAGSGKTYQLSNRLIGMVAKGIDPEKLVALTFTRKAAGEFAEEIMKKLVAALRDEAVAARLRSELELAGDFDFQPLLRRVVDALPGMFLGTMDSFFAKIVRGFQHEMGITSGTFQLVEGATRDEQRREMLAEILGKRMAEEESEAFMRAYRRASHGRTAKGVMRSLEKFVEAWYPALVSRGGKLHWGLPDESAADGAARFWETNKAEMTTAFLEALDASELTAAQGKSLRGAVEKMANHTPGSGVFQFDGKSIWSESLIASFLSGKRPLTFINRKEFALGPAASELLDILLEKIRLAEIEVGLERIRGVGAVMAEIETRSERLRRQGLLGFDDVKRLLGEWRLSEDARLRREAIDFRLDARHEHWLLDEFQDTSLLEWRGIEPLLSEAASDDERSLFVVGDKKQAIYGWRGGEVKLFDRVREAYRMEVETMPTSRRSCPEVLDLVNRVCGDSGTMRSFSARPRIVGSGRTMRRRTPRNPATPRSAWCPKRGGWPPCSSGCGPSGWGSPASPPGSCCGPTPRSRRSRNFCDPWASR